MEVAILFVGARGDGEGGGDGEDSYGIPGSSRGGRGGLDRGRRGRFVGGMSVIMASAGIEMVDSLGVGARLDSVSEISPRGGVPMESGIPTVVFILVMW